MGENILPLVIFTLAMQFSVGIVLIYSLFLLFPLFRSKNSIPRRFKWILIIASVAALAGIFTSFLHLGSPVQAFRALTNLGNSWLSREILMVLVYSVFLGSLALVQFLNPSPKRQLHWLMIGTVAAGLILIYFMSGVYGLPTHPAWNSIFTPIGFYLASVATGSSLLLLFQISSGSWASQKALAIMTIAIPVIQLALLPVHMTWLNQANETTQKSLEILLNENLILFLARMAAQALTIGFGMWALFSIRSDFKKNRYLFIPATGAFCFITLTFILDRLLFFLHGLPAGGICP